MSSSPSSPLPSVAQATAELTAKGGFFELSTYQAGGVELRCYRHVPPTIRELVLRSRNWGARDYLVYENERLTYAACFERVATLAHRLVDDLGVRKGDRIAIAMRNYPEWVVAFWAAASVGAISVPLNAWWTGPELAYGLLDSGSSVLFADRERIERIAPLLPSLPALAPERVFAIRTPGPLAAGLRSWEDLLAAGAQHGDLPEAAIDPEDDATIFYTSGTTGNPKGALGTHRNLVTNLGNSGFIRARAQLRKGLTPAAPGPDIPQLATLLSVPLFHVTGSHSTLAFATHIGSKLVLMYKWTPERALELIERERVNTFGGVPSMAWQVLESPELEKHDISSITGVNYGGAPSAPELVRRLKQVFPEASPSNGYGLTETSALATGNTGIDYQLKPDSVGPPLPVCDVRVVGDDGQDVPQGEIGELWIRGPNIVKGYWNKPEATAQTFAGGWLRTGDLVRIDDEGFVYVLDRAKDMLIRGGENIYCVEVENVLYQHPDVMDAAVVGLPHRVLGEEVAAVVQLTPESTLTPEQLQRHAAAHLAAFKVPVRIELRAEPLPRNANGKILKRQLRSELEATLKG
jgi:long-chain acyl-CoA synthetase